MTTAGQIGFRFRERMVGPLSAGTDEPRTGAQRGRTAGTVFVADLDVSIRDLAACFRDPQHVARLDGTVSFPGLASGRPLHDGQLFLYVPDSPSGAKLMRYRFGFQADSGAEFFLDGTKILHTPWASPREQVTLYTRVHEGGPNGPVWGAGILLFHLRDLPGFLMSMRATGASRVQGLRMFLGFARRELMTPA